MAKMELNFPFKCVYIVNYAGYQIEDEHNKSGKKTYKHVV